MKTCPLPNGIEIEFRWRPSNSSHSAPTRKPPLAKMRSRAFLPKCNENAPARMRACAARLSHFYRAKFIPQLSANRRTIIFTDSGNDAGSVLNGNGKYHDQ